MQFYDDVMTYFFGATVTVESQIKEVHEIMDLSIRDIKREIMTTKRERNLTINELRRKAATSNKSSSRELTQLAIKCRRSDNQLVKLNATVEKITTFKHMASQLRANEAQTRAFVKMTQAMTKLNEGTNTFQLCALINQYERQNLLLKEKQEFIDDKIEEAYEDSEGEEEEAENILEEILEELHIKMTGELPDIQRNGPKKQSIVAEEKEEGEGESKLVGEDDLLASRVANLK